MEMKDVLLLTLHKQHYADRYGSELFQKNISCLGYYDEITISDLSEDNPAREKQKCRLSKKKSNAPTSAIWYGIGEQIRSLTGGYSNQNIGIFRSATYKGHQEHLQEYWKMEEQLPFFGIGFIKLDDIQKYKKLCEEIENEIWTDEEPDASCKVILYSTFENADLIILCKSNKWSLLEKVFCTIQQKNAVLYVHSILGIDEAYIRWCGEQKDSNEDKLTHTSIFSEWNGIRCFAEEQIKRITFKIATCGSKEILEEIHYQWKRVEDQIVGNDTTKFSCIIGHSDIELVLTDTNVATLITFLLPGGILTHTNPAYSKGMYNVETSIRLKEEEWSTVGSNSIQGESQSDFRNSCRILIKKYKELLDETDRYEEGLYSYYQALILTLNILTQYENFSMSRNVYELIVPSFQVFDEQLGGLWKETRTICDRDLKKKYLNQIKLAIEQYLDCVNSVIYHTIHTDQVYLMIPGYSGTFFSIPIKLSQFYMWFLMKVTEVLNDGEHKYGCIFMPVMETKPVTKEIEIHSGYNDKLICVKLSQRELYFPRNLMIILCHELGHYISDKMRSREKRLDCIMESMSYTLVEGMIPQNGIVIPLQMDSEQWNTYIIQLKDKLREKIYELMKEEKSTIFKDEGYYSKDIIEPLILLCKKVLSEDDLGAEIKDMIYSFSQPINDYVNEDNKKYAIRMMHIYETQRQIDKNRIRLLESDVLASVISSLVTIYKEVYSDIVAVKILKCEQEDFEESFAVSEGVIYEEQEEPENEFRMGIADVSVFGTMANNIKDYKVEWMTSDGGIKSDETLERYLYDNIYYFEWNINKLLCYVDECMKKLDKYLIDKVEILNDIRYIYLMFCDKAKSKEEIYSEIVNCIEDYKNITELLTNENIFVDKDEI